MATLFTTIAADRYATGRLWTPELSLDMLGNHWSALSGSFLWGGLAEQNESHSDESWHNFSPAITLNVGYPDDYALDATFDGMEMELGVDFQIRVANGTLGSETNIRLVQGGTPGTALEITRKVYRTDSTTPAHVTYTGLFTGVTVFSLQYQFNAALAETLFVKRDASFSSSDYLVVKQT